jgi:hypothetical protein
MSLLLLPTIAQSRQRFSAQALDYFSRLDAVGALIPAYRSPIAAYIDALVALGGAYWNNMSCHCLFAGVGYAGTVVPLRNGMVVPTLVNFVSGDHNSVTGLKGDGATKHVDTNRNNNAEGQNDQSVSIFIEAAQTAGTAAAYFGAGGAANGSMQISRAGLTPANLITRSRTTTSTATSSVGGSVGFVGINRSLGASYNLRASGASTTITQASQAPFNGNIFIFRTNDISPLYTDARFKAYHVGPAITQSVLEGLQNTLFAAIT